jgi:hypothetical protein
MRVSLHSSYYFVFSTFLSVVPITQGALNVPWSDKKYGPDGPWQAVRIKVGGYDQSLDVDAQNHADLDVYPGGTFDSFTFSSLACKSYPNSNCGKGGFWDPDPGAMDWFADFAGAWHPLLEDKSYGLVAGPKNYTQRALTIGGQTVWNASFSHSNIGNITHFNGKIDGMQLGTLSLGAPDSVQNFNTATQPGFANQNVTGQIFNSKLHQDNKISSYSYGLHIGSAAFGYPGSLVFGGYNKGRVIGPITSMFRDFDRIDLLDINIGVEYGSSPFDFESKNNLLVSDTGVVGTTQQVKVDPSTPYLSLPDNTCEGLAAVLPIKLDQTTKLYHWQVEDPTYKKIVTSPAYLGFVFPPGRGMTTNVTIKVPFALLNLTLESSIVEKPTQYFPCHSFTPQKNSNDPTSNDDFRLGRAFLQAAFIGRNWVSGTTWMSQAPGPGYGGSGLGDEIKEIQDRDTTIESWDSTNTNYFNQSWTGHWSVVDSPRASNTTGSSPATSSSSDNATAATDTALSTGAKAGIGIGSAAVVIAAVAVALLYRRSRARAGGVKETEPPATAAYVDDGPADYKPPIESIHRYNDNPGELQLQNSPQEIFTEPRFHELADHSVLR